MLCFVEKQTAEALAEQVTQEHFENGLIYPSFTNICKISTHIAARVAAKAYELGKKKAQISGPHLGSLLLYLPS